jgi:hypothetical protein
MINSIEDLRSSGVLPTGPVSAWPQERNISGPEMEERFHPGDDYTKRPIIAQEYATEVKAGFGQMATGLARNVGIAFTNGRVEGDIREERFDLCKACPAFIPKTQRCSECGCFMAAKTWLNGNPQQLCPLKKWSR